MANQALASMELPSVEALQSTEQIELLNAVDSLRAHGLSEITALPQLIVVGDQSSGKSSVLEAISGVPFPKEDNLCTRFATEVILRHTTVKSISVSIMPASDRSDKDKDQIKQFRHQLSSKEDFPSLFKEAKKAMGILDGGKSFSRDILRVEICGPSQPQLTLVDLPGLTHSATISQTDADIKLVGELVGTYLSSPRSIILAVISAKNDHASQIILNRAREVDPQGKRTLGIITKPDTLASNSSSERAFIALARNEDVRFDLGWHVVRNIDSTVKNIEGEDRDKQETSFFSQSNFRNLPSQNIGITALRSRLSKVLFNQIRIELPRLLEDIEAQIEETKAKRDRLGRNRPEVADQKAFLIEISQSFTTICENAVRGNYEHQFFHIDANPERRLCANIMNKHFEFADKLRKRGSSYIIIEKETLPEPDEQVEDWRYRTREEAVKKACERLRMSRGQELPGLPNPLLVGELFREYSRPWKNLADWHIESVWHATNKFIELVLEHLTEVDVAEKILRFWISPIMEERLGAAKDMLSELLEVHKENPITTNHYFTDNRNKLRQKKIQEEAEERLRRGSLRSDQKLAVEDLPLILSILTPKSYVDMDKIAAEDALDNMNAYYKVAMKLFMDNVPTLAVQAPIVRKVPMMLRPSDVFEKMDDKIVTKIAGESEEKASDRRDTELTLTKLEAGARICRQYAPRARSKYESDDRTVQKHTSKVSTATSTTSSAPIIPSGISNHTPPKVATPKTTNPFSFLSKDPTPLSSVPGTGLFGSGVFGSGTAKPPNIIFGSASLNDTAPKTGLFTSPGKDAESLGSTPGPFGFGAYSNSMTANNRASPFGSTPFPSLLASKTSETKPSQP